MQADTLFEFNKEKPKDHELVGTERRIDSRR